MRESPDAPSFSSLPDPFEAYRPRLLLGISAGAAAGLMVVATATGVFRGPLAGLEWAGFWVALALFCAAPLMQRWTSSVLVGVSLLLAGGAVSIFVPAYFAGGLRAPQVIWLLVVPMLAPFYFGFRVTLVSGVLSLAAFTLLFALGLSGALPVASPDTTGFHTFMNLALAIVFVMAVSISTHRAMRQNSQSLLLLKQEIERRSEELAESESRKSAILDSAVAGLISTDADARVVEFNPAASQILGYTREEAIGQKLVDFLIPNSLRDAHSSAYQRAVEHPSPPMSAEPRQLVALCSNGEEIPVEVLLQRIPVAGPSQFMAQLRDLRAERRTEAMVRRREQQLHRAQRLEGVGRLAGGVAHDFNNLLMVIGGYSESIETDPNASDWIREQAGEVLRATQQAASITRQLLAFSRGQELTLGAVPLEKLLTEFEPTIRTLLPSEIQLSTNREPARWPVRANWTELERIVINLVMNAVDAMPEGGQLSISTEYLEFAATSSDSPPNLEPGSYARLQVIDDGVGMTPEVLSHAFEPFFTTKEVGKGTGLGLASVYGAVQQLGGLVEIQSAPGLGTRVSVYLPDAASEETRNQLGVSTAAPLERQRTILLADDESAIRKLIATCLRNEGHRVLEAADGEEALAFATLGEDKIDLLISDVVMPKFSGTNLAGELRERHPELPLLFVSGFLGNEELDLKREFPGAQFMAKPLRLKSLLVTVDMLLHPGRKALEDPKVPEAPVKT